MTLYLRRMPCIVGVSQFNLVLYNIVTFAFQLQKLARVARLRKSFKKKSVFKWIGSGFACPSKTPPNLAGFLGSGLCDPSYNACEPFFKGLIL